MSLAILYESQEWSSFALAKYLGELLPGVAIKLYDLETVIEIEEILDQDLIINRIFASANFRGHRRSISLVQEVLEEAKNIGKPILNSYEAHFYEMDKYLASQVMSSNNLPVPEIYGCFNKSQGLNSIKARYPLIIKPNCGGRSQDTHVVYSDSHLKTMWAQLNPEVSYLAQEYITPREGFITRIELIGGDCVQILRKMLTADGLATYNLGSKFFPYPECRLEVQQEAQRTMELLNIEMGSLDIVEAQDGFYIIDVNSVSNTSEDFVQEINFDLMLETAKYIANKYKGMCWQDFGVLKRRKVV